jgi:hypothetical protein
VFLFENVSDGIKHFADITGVNADRLPSREEIEEMKKEEETLPPARQMYWVPDHRRAAVTALGFGYLLPPEQGGGGFIGTSGGIYTQSGAGSTEPAG